MDSQSTPSSALAFEKAREAIITLKTLKPSLSHDELETLELLLDNEAMETVEKSVKEAEKGEWESLDSAIDSD